MSSSSRSSGRRSKGRVRGALHRARLGAQNAAEIVRLGHLGDRIGRPYEILHRSPTYALRHYPPSQTSDAPAPLLLLVPPLMLTAEIYDVSPELSAVTQLAERGIDAYVVDFGAPERQAGGMQRTLDDHVQAVADAVGQIQARVGEDRSVHLAGYSQGGMFAYQAAALRRSEGVASVITFGSPVDIHRNVPNVHSGLVARAVNSIQPLLDVPLAKIEGLPGTLTSNAFKLLSVRREAAQVVEFLQKLHDRQALEKREARRRFLAGEGFVAWPGPALRKFIEDFVVHNRMVSGGFVIDGQTVTLADIHCPILCFVGKRDELARPAAVRAIQVAAPEAEVFEISLSAGHFGLVVGHVAQRDSWPSVAQWLLWREGTGPRPTLIDGMTGRDAPSTVASPSTDQRQDEDASDELTEESADEARSLRVAVQETLWGSVQAAWKRLGHIAQDATDAVDAVRYQLPRLQRLSELDQERVTSFSASLRKRVQEHPDATFFLWRGRAFTYKETDRRIDAVVRGLWEAGVRPGQQVAVWMQPRPSLLSAVTALNRMGVEVLLMHPDLSDAAAKDALGGVEIALADPDLATRLVTCAPEALKTRLLLGGAGSTRPRPEGLFDLEGLQVEELPLPASFDPDRGRAGDVALTIISPQGDGSRRARITNRRWALSAYGAAAACTLTSKDTVYCCLPLHHPAGLIVAAGGAVAGGCRLAVATRFEPSTFWDDTIRYGATVVFYAGEMLRDLTLAPVHPRQRQHHLRLMAGSGLRADVWTAVHDRFGVSVLEFYASTEGNLVLANAAGTPVGALGRRLPGSTEFAIVRYDFAERRPVRERDGGPMIACGPDEPGLLLGKATRAHPNRQAGKGVLFRHVFERGDDWFPTKDIVRQDKAGNVWLVDRVDDVILREGRPVFSRGIEDAFYRAPAVKRCAVFATGEAEHPVVVAAVVLRQESAGARPQAARALADLVLPSLGLEERPDRIIVVDKLEETDGFRPLKDLLRNQPLPETVLSVWAEEG